MWNCWHLAAQVCRVLSQQLVLEPDVKSSLSSSMLVHWFLSLSQIFGHAFRHVFFNEKDLVLSRVMLWLLCFWCCFGAQGEILREVQVTGS